MSYISLISKVRNNFLLSNASPPTTTTTDSNEFLALFIGIRTSFSINLSKFLISEPPPDYFFNKFYDISRCIGCYIGISPPSLIKTSCLKLLKYHYHHLHHIDRLPHLSFMYSYLSLFFFYLWHLPVFI